MYRKIVNPITGRKVNITGVIGRKILQNYLHKLNRYTLKGGFPSRMPNCRACKKVSSQEGGGCEKDSDCSPYKDGRRKICSSKSGRCVLETGKAGKEELGRRGSTSSSKKTSPKKKKPSPKKKQTSAKKTKVKKMIKKGKTVHPKLLKATHTRVPKNKAAKKAAAEKRLADDCEMIKSSKKGDRISAKCYYDTFGKESTIGDKCSPAYSGGEGCLRVDKNGRPRWAKCNDTDAQTACRYSQ